MSRKNHEQENLSRDEHRVAELIGTLRHVDAPGDFEARVRGRIAEKRGSNPRMSWRPILAGVAALVVLAFVGYVGFRSLSSRANTPETIANTNTAAPASSAPVPQNQPPVTGPAPSATVDVGPNLAGSKPPSTNSATSSNTQPTQPGGGSYTEASRDSNVIQQPGRISKGYDPSRGPIARNAGLGTGQIPLKMLLDGIGIHATWNNGWRVDSVDANNLAGRSGVRAGDVIEAVDGQPVTETMTFKATFSGKSLRVRRDGSVVDIPFKP
ncbi:MAG: hypothetical protein JO314_12390 [Acidobacteria bacterium]|nr:hypothetical protein [Acidobacteriota bacterium]